MSDKLIEAFLSRMSQEEKERVLEMVVEKFFDERTAEEKQCLVERLIPRLLENVDMKDVVSQLLTSVWKDSKESGVLEKMAKVASHTSGRLSEFMPERMKRRLSDEIPKEETS